MEKVFLKTIDFTISKNKRFVSNRKKISNNQKYYFPVASRNRPIKTHYRYYPGRPPFFTEKTKGTPDFLILFRSFYSNDSED